MSTEIDEATGAILRDVPGLEEHMFPDKICLISPAALVSAVKRTHYDEDARHWRLWPITPNTSFAEQSATFFNAFGDAIHSAWTAARIDTTRYPLRKWKQTPFDALDIEGACPPNLALWSVGKPGWPDVVAYGAAVDMSADPEAAHPLQSIIDAAGAVMGQQPDRGYVLALAVTRKCDLKERLQLVVVDRTGLVSGTPFLVHDPESIEHLVRIVAGMMFAKRTRLGHDPTVYRRSNRSFVRIRGVDFTAAARADAEIGIESPVVEGFDAEKTTEAEFEILEWTSDVRDNRLIQSGTACWRVRGPDGREYAMREAWDPSHEVYGYNREREIVAVLGHIAGVPDIVAGGAVEVNGVPWTTNAVRACIDGNYKHCMPYVAAIG